MFATRASRPRQGNGFGCRHRSLRHPVARDCGALAGRSNWPAARAAAVEAGAADRLARVAAAGHHLDDARSATGADSSGLMQPGLQILPLVGLGEIEPGTDLAAATRASDCRPIDVIRRPRAASAMVTLLAVLGPLFATVDVNVTVS